MTPASAPTETDRAAASGGAVKLEAKTLRKEYGDLVAVDDVSLAVESGEFLAILGPSGSGKTTLLQLIAGLETPTSGRVFLDGEDVTDRTPQERNIGLIFQNLALFRKLTVRENLGFAPSVAGESDEAVEQKVREIAETVGIDESLLDRQAGKLNPSEQQRVAAGRSIVAEPELLLLDEPVDNLDEHQAINMRGELKKLQNDLDQTMIYVTHDQEEAMSLADRIVVMHRGEIQQVGSPRTLYERPANRFIAGFIGSPSMNFFTGTVTASGIEVLGTELSATMLTEARDEAEQILAHDAVTLGIRPEVLRYGATDADVEFTATLTELEPTGPEELLHAEAAGEELTLLTDQRTGATPGDSFQVGVDVADIYVFDPDTNQVYY